MVFWRVPQPLPDARFSRAAGRKGGGSSLFDCDIPKYRYFKVSIMLPRISRLPYSEFRSRGYLTVATPFFALKIKKRTGGMNENRIGVIISTAVLKSAARRNFWKRQARVNFKLIPDAGNDFLVIFSKNIKNRTTKEFKEAFLRAARVA